ncbi:coiled-coil domain-containing protein [Plantactinospora siamensis]|uniref:Coiled-coil domain-containing protein n=1 Tax=Plantactinospora siamensis TaxID=555372 RepID=A0ABV6P0A8_9ACTN
MAPARRTAAVIAALLGAALSCAVPALPASAGPVTALAAAPNGTDDEGGSDTLRQQLDAASRGYLDAKAKLDNSTKRQKELASHLDSLDGEARMRSQTVGNLAGAAYRTGRIGPVTALLNSDSPDGFLDTAARLQVVASNEDRQLRALLDTRDQESRAKQAVEKEIAEQRTQLAVMGKRKQQAEQALAVAARGRSTAGSGDTGDTGSPGGTSTAVAKAAPRNSDGSWPAESCSVNDPTTTGCITPRTLHAMNEARAAGFTHFVSCHRNGGSGEHPKGRACDFAAAKGGFEGVASGADKTYGNNLAAYFIKNSDRLAVLYVIWFKRIWLPSSGWKAYSGGNGDPSSDHTNHVHLSVY